MSYIDTETNQELSVQDVRARHPEARHHSLWDAQLLHSWGLAELRGEDTAPPDHEPWERVEPDWHKAPGVWTRIFRVVERDDALEVCRETLLRRFASEWEQLKNTPPVSHGGRPWRGGSSSAQGIMAEAQLSEHSGRNSTKLYDAEGNERSYSTSEAKDIAAAVNAEYQKNYGRYMGVWRAINNANSINALLSVKWPSER